MKGILKSIIREFGIFGLIMFLAWNTSLIIIVYLIIYHSK